VRELDEREARHNSELEYKIKEKIKKVEADFEKKRITSEQHFANLKTRTSELERRADAQSKG
jgi:hypothetical protein